MNCNEICVCVQLIDSGDAMIFFLDTVFLDLG